MNAATLNTEPNFGDADAFYAALTDLFRDSSEEEAERKLGQFEQRIISKPAVTAWCFENPPAAILFAIDHNVAIGIRKAHVAGVVRRSVPWRYPS